MNENGMISSTWTTPARCGSAADVVPGRTADAPGASSTARAGAAPTSATAAAKNNTLPNAVILMAPLLASSRREPILEVATETRPATALRPQFMQFLHLADRSSGRH